MPTDCELAARTRIRAVRVDQSLLLIAEGELPSPGFRIDIRQDPRRIFPPQFDLLRCQLPGSFPQVITPYRYAETVRFPADQTVVTVHHADGADQVTIEDYSTELQGYAPTPCGAVPTAPVRQTLTRPPGSPAISASTRRSPRRWPTSRR
jgi:hypothetical protein